MTKPTLRSAQAQFIAAIYNDKASVHDLIALLDQLDPRAAINIYRGSVVGNLSNALADIFPVTKALVGDTFFNALALRYVEQTPSQSANLNHYGKSFPEFMRQFSPLATLPYIGDVGQLEWYWHEAFNAADETPIDPHVLQALSPEQQLEARLKPLQCLFLLRSEFPIDRIWQSNQKDAGDEAVDLAEGPCALLVWRSGLHVRIDRVNELQFNFLDLCHKGKSLGTIFEALLSNHSEQALIDTLGQVLGRWIAQIKTTKL